MCMFNLPVEEVHATNIFVAQAGPDTQLTVYSNAVQSKEKSKNAMVLPFPAGPVQLINMTNSANFFDSLAKCFPMIVSKTIAKSSRSWNPQRNLLDNLKIYKVGSYKVSVARGIADLERADKSVFKLSDNLSSVLKSSYSRGFDFLVCAFDEAVGQDHPFGYVHRLLDARDAEIHRLFVPTRHAHGNNLRSSLDDKAHWDHAIFSTNTTVAKQAGPSTSALEKTLQKDPRVKDGSMTVRPAQEFNPVLKQLPVDITKTKKLRRLKVRGRERNRDLYFDFAYSDKDVTLRKPRNEKMVIDVESLPGDPQHDTNDEMKDIVHSDNAADQKTQEPDILDGLLQEDSSNKVTPIAVENSSQGSTMLEKLQECFATGFGGLGASHTSGLR